MTWPFIKIESPAKGTSVKRNTQALPGLALSLIVALLLIFSTANNGYADLRVNKRKDIIILKDGKKVACTILMITARGALVIVESTEDEKDKDAKPTQAKQLLIPKADIRKIIKGKDEGQTKGFQTEVELARKVIKGSGFRKRKKKDMAEDPNLPAGPIKKAAPLLPGVILKPGIVQPPGNSKQTPKQLADRYLTRYPRLKGLAKAYLGKSNALPLMFKKAQEGDPIIKAQLQGALELIMNGEEKQTSKPSKSTQRRRSGR